MSIYKIIIVVLALSIAGPLSGAQAQGESLTEVLARATVESLPVPDAEVWFIRMTLEPGGSLPPDEQIGPTFVFAESGLFMMAVDRALTVQRGVATATPEPIEGEAVLESGDSALVSDGTTLAIRNNGSEPASVLALMIIDPGREGVGGDGEEETTEEPVGVTFQVISIGHGSFVDGPATLTIERVLVAPGETARAGVAGGVEVGAIESGKLQLTLASGDGWVWPAVAASATGDDEAESPERTDLAVGSLVDLSEGDGYALTDAAAELKAGDAESTILRAVIAPVEQR